MKDLDFDELDRAVNSLMKDAPKAEPEPKLTEEQTVTISPTIKDGDKPSLAHLSQAVSDINGPATPTSDAAPVQDSSATSLSQPKEAPKEEPAPETMSSPTSVPTLSVAARRGKFMDVVRPGAAKQPEQLVRRPSREGQTIDPRRPVVNDIIPVPPPITPQEPVVAAEPSAPTTAEVKVEPPSVVPAPPVTKPEAKDEQPKEDWPDPIAMAGYEESELPVKRSDIEKKPDAEAPLVSPFLPDAKVEKRPLGGQPTPVSSPEMQEPEASENTETSAEPSNGAPAAQLPANPANEKPLPEELSGDVMALESDANTAATMKPVPVEEEVAPAQTPEVVPENPPATPEPVPAISSASVAPPTSGAAISIPQQYKEEPSSGDTSTGSIYDTDTYHKPLAHPGKKKSGWMWVIWIILILILGAGAGAALYYFKVF